MKRYVIAGLLAFGLAAPAVLAQPFPSRQITMIVGFAAGGGTDTAARIIAKPLAEVIGQPVVVENRPGAGGNIAADLLAKAAPDGHTIGLVSPGPLTVAPHMVAKLPYDPLRDFAPLTMAVTFPNVLVVNAGVPAQNLAEFVRLANSRPGTITCGSSGIGGIGHLSCELLKMVAKVDLVHVPYKGGAPAMTDLLSGQIASIFATPITAGPHVKAGRIRALATTGATRASSMPDVPTVAESGYPGFEAVNWYCFVAPAKTPKDALDRLRRDLVAVIGEPGVREQLASHGMDAASGGPEELARYIEREYAIWGRVVKAAGITVN